MADVGNMKNFTKAFVNDLKTIVCDGLSAYATYNDDGIPTTEGVRRSMEENPISLELVTSLQKDEDEHNGYDGLHRIIAAPVWKDQGYPIFTLKPELAASLLLTDFPSDISEINPPFPACMICIQDPTPLNILGEDFHTIMFLEVFNHVRSWCTWTMPRDTATRRIHGPPLVSRFLGEFAKSLMFA